MDSQKNMMLKNWFGMKYIQMRKALFDEKSKSKNENVTGKRILSSMKTLIGRICLKAFANNLSHSPFYPWAPAFAGVTPVEVAVLDMLVGR